MSKEVQNIYDFHKIENLSENKYIKELMSINSKEEVSFGVAGGFCRNYMLNSEENTDIDIITDDVPYLENVFLKYFDTCTSKDHIITKFLNPQFKILDNTMHFAYGIFTSFIDEVNYVFPSPEFFDFTINLGAISIKDGYLYAPPITIFDIKHKIIRPCILAFEEEESYRSVSLGLSLRAIRFALKYKMKIHEVALKSMHVLFSLQNYTGNVNDRTLYYYLSKIMKETQEFKKEYYNALRSLSFIDTDKYSTFESYFKNITSKIKKDEFRTFDYIIEPNTYNQNF